MSTTAFSCESASGFGTDIWAARTRADGTWGTPVAVAHGLSPQLVVDGSGRVTVAYRLRHGAGVGAVRWSGGSWHVPVVLAQPPPNLSFIPSIALAANARGDVMLTWAQQEDCCGGRHIGFIVATRPHDGSWGPSVIVSRKDRFGRTFLDAQGRGTAVSSRLLFRRTTAGRWTSRALPAIEGYLSGVAANAGGDLMLSARDPDGAPSMGARPCLEPRSRARAVNDGHRDCFPNTAARAAQGIVSAGFLEIARRHLRVHSRRPESRHPLSL